MQMLGNFRFMSDLLVMFCGKKTEISQWRENISMQANMFSLNRFSALLEVADLSLALILF